MSSASTTLDDIIDELKLTYDLSVGLLDGDAVREIPNVNILTNLTKLFQKLYKELDEVESRDSDIEKRINVRLGKKKEDDQEDAIENTIVAEENDQEKEIENNENLNKRQTEDGEVKSSPKRRKVDDSIVKTEENELNEEEFVPPVQTGSYTQDNDIRLKNPKSEFVTSQTLSSKAISELGLFSDDENGLLTQGKEYLKRKYGVASYPERDLKDLLPGEIPDFDFSKTKAPSNQVQFSTFQSYIESYFRPFLNEDLKFLNESNVIPPELEKSNYDPNVTPFIIPKLGQFYADVWADESAPLGSKLNSPSYNHSADSYKAKGSIDDLNDDKLYSEEISCGPLSSRLLAAILSNHEGGTEDENELQFTEGVGSEEVATQLNSSENYKVSSEVNDFYSIEERLKRELKYIGIFMNLNSDDLDNNRSKIGNKFLKNAGNIIDSDEWIKNKEDDEICTEIRYLQKDLKQAINKNRQNKKLLIPIVEEQIAYQEYCTILEDLDKQVDQAYMKRLKAKNKKKKPDQSSPQQSVNTGMRALLDKRKRWISNIGKLFKPAEIMKRIPSENILNVENAEEELDIDDNDNDNETAGESIIDK